MVLNLATVHVWVSGKAELLKGSIAIHSLKYTQPYKAFACVVFCGWCGSATTFRFISCEIEDW